MNFFADRARPFRMRDVLLISFPIEVKPFNKLFGDSINKTTKFPSKFFCHKKQSDTWRSRSRRFCKQMKYAYEQSTAVHHWSLGHRKQLKVVASSSGEGNGLLHWATLKDDTMHEFKWCRVVDNKPVTCSFPMDVTKISQNAFLIIHSSWSYASNSKIPEELRCPRIVPVSFTWLIYDILFELICSYYRYHRVDENNDINE